MDGNLSSRSIEMNIRKATDEERKLLFPQFIKQIEDPPKHVKGNILIEYFAFENLQIVGWAFIRTLQTPFRYSVGIFLIQEERGKGLGQKLLTTLLTESDEKEIEPLFASIFIKNISSQKIFERSRFEKLNETTIEKKRVYRYSRTIQEKEE